MKDRQLGVSPVNYSGSDSDICLVIILPDFAEKYMYQ